MILKITDILVILSISIMVVMMIVPSISSFQQSCVNLVLKGSYRSARHSFAFRVKSNCVIAKPHGRLWKNNRHYASSKSNDFDDFTFHEESFDKAGRWMTIDYDNIPIDKQLLPQDGSTNIQNSNRNANDNDKSNSLQNVFAPIHPSPVEAKLIKDKLVYIKRDDLLHLRNSNVSGNKARKMLALNELNVDDFPDVVVSYGGPQSNAMVALAAIVQSKNIQWEKEEVDGSDGPDQIENDTIDEIESDGWIMKDDPNDFRNDDDDDLQDDKDWQLQDRLDGDSPRKKRFIYYTKKLPRYLRNQPNGNLLRALTLGMEMVQLKPDVYRNLFGGVEGGSAIAPIEAPVEGSSLWIPQGGACGVSSQGAKLMADEILSFWSKNAKGRPLSVCVPGGTCTTAMLLSKELNAKIRTANIGNDEEGTIDIDVVVIPCVGDADYAFRQMRALDKSLGGNGRDDIPKILKPVKRAKYFRFGEPVKEILETYNEMRTEHGLFLDLLYGAPAWNILLEHLDFFSANSKSKSPIQGRQVMYVHSGGLDGVSSQLTRYKHKGLIDSNQVQN